MSEVRKIYTILVLVMLGCISCEWQLRLDESDIAVDRYDRIQSLYLTTSDFSALQQMNTVYPMQTRTLIEDILRIGKVNDPQISAKFLHFYQDSTLQLLINEAEQQYANMDDINEELNVSFRFLQKEFPGIELPEVYAQIGSLDQSIIIGNGMVGICLDKYLGEDCPLYLKPEYGYSAEQRKMMQRNYIVPDCIGFYLLSLYPLKNFDTRPQEVKDLHMGKVMWTVNQSLGERVFNTEFIKKVDSYMKKNPNITVKNLLEDDNYSVF